MKKLILTSALFLGITAVSSGQSAPPPPPGPPHQEGRAPKGEGRKKEDGEKKSERREKVEAMKIGYLTTQLDLSPEEAQKFWPVYNQYQDKERELRKTHKMKSRENDKNLDEMSDKEVEALVDDEIVFRQKELDLQKEYHKQFKSVLPPRKVARLYRAEELFKRELVRKLQEK